MIILYLFALYCDILKNFQVVFIPSFITDNMIFIIGCIIIFINIRTFKKNFLSKLQIKFIYINLLLILTYSISLITSFLNVEIITLSSILHYLYVLIPILYFSSFIILYPINSNTVFKINKYIILGFFFIVFVGIIQNTINPDFLFNTNYFERNNLTNTTLRVIGNETFIRIKSIYASSERFNSISLVVLYCCLYNLSILRKSYKNETFNKLIYPLGILSSITGILLSGLRLTILILGASLLITFFAFFTKSKFSKLELRKFKILISKKLKAFLTIFITFLSIPIVFPSFFLDIINSFQNIGVIRLFSSNIDNQQNYSRIMNDIGLGRQFIYENLLLGNGLGSIAYGKPGETTLYSTIYESGIILGPIIILLLCLIGITIFYQAINVIRLNTIFANFILISYSMKFLSSLILGLTVAYEPFYVFLSLPTIIGSFYLLDKNSKKDHSL